MLRSSLCRLALACACLVPLTALAEGVSVRNDAGDVADRAVYFRNDLAVAANPAVPKNPHTFLTNIGSAAAAPYAVVAQQQIAVFFASHGTVVIDPDGAGPFFEVPIGLPLPEGLNYLP